MPESLFPKKWHRPSLEQSGGSWRARLEHLQLGHATANIPLPADRCSRKMLVKKNLVESNSNLILTFLT